VEDFQADAVGPHGEVGQELLGRGSEGLIRHGEAGLGALMPLRAVGVAAAVDHRQVAPESFQQAGQGYPSGSAGQQFHGQRGVANGGAQFVDHSRVLRGLAAAEYESVKKKPDRFLAREFVDRDDVAP